MKKYIFLFLFFIASCDYVDDVAEDAAKNAMGECPTQTQIENIILEAVDSSFDLYREEIKKDMKQVLQETLAEYISTQKEDFK